MNEPSGVTQQDIYGARLRIAGRVVRTPLIRSYPLGDRSGARVHMKLENVQQTGSFKLRGATNSMLRLDARERANGVIAVSSGNHGRAVSYVARELGVSAVVCVAENVPANKVEGIRRYGAEVVIAGPTYNEAAARAGRLQRERGLSFVHPFDHPDVIAGQGTVGLEILEDLPTVDTVLVPLSGGGLISGVAVAIKASNPDTRVIGVMMERAPVMYHCLKEGRIVDRPEEPTLADALAGGLGKGNRYTFGICRALLDDVVLVSEDEIAAAMSFLLTTHHLVAEGGGAVGVAALLGRRVQSTGDVAVVVSGGNVDIPLLIEVAGRRL